VPLKATEKNDDARGEVQESSNTPGYTKMHCAIPVSKKKKKNRIKQLQAKVFSEANLFNTTNIAHLEDKDYQVEDVRGFLT
jgi:hypothetical protein